MLGKTRRRDTEAAARLQVYLLKAVLQIDLPNWGSLLNPDYFAGKANYASMGGYN